MTNKTEGVDYSKVTPELLALIREVIADGANHRYSTSKVYTAHNAAFGLNETPASCSSCLIARVGRLSQWLTGYISYATKAEPKEQPKAEPKEQPKAEPATVAPKLRKPRAAAQPSKDDGHELM